MGSLVPGPEKGWRLWRGCRDAHVQAPSLFRLWRGREVKGTAIYAIMPPALSDQLPRTISLLPDSHCSLLILPSECHCTHLQVSISCKWAHSDFTRTGCVDCFYVRLAFGRIWSKTGFRCNMPPWEEIGGRRQMASI